MSPPWGSLLLLHLLGLLVLVTHSDTVNPLEGGMAQRLLSQREELLQPGLSYVSGELGQPTEMNLDTVVNISLSSQVREREREAAESS